ncbi:MAG: glycosyl hydrolase 53 family protein [bacterium]|nr:glycosyl hydrolase 53 family protein [bacterium]
MNKHSITAVTALSLFTAALPSYAEGGSPANASVTADKTAQWTNQEAAANYDLRIHGWNAWETAAYIGFTLPEDFTPSALKNAVLRLDTLGASASGEAYIYAADYGAFDNGTQYEGASAPSYSETEILSFTSPAAAGEFDIDLTDYIASLPSGTSTAAFRIDVKSQDTNNNWVIGSLTNAGTAPKLLLDYGTGAPEPGTIQNSRFSDGLNEWTAEGSADVKEGALVLTGGSARVSQKVTGIEDGIYDVGAKAMTSDISGTAYVYAKAEGQTAAKTAIPQSSAAMTITVPGVSVRNGVLEVGVYADGKDENTVTLDDFTLTKSAPTRVPFLKGGEISKLTYVEDMGAKFFRADGSEADALQIMAENGFNLARIRLLDDPGKGHGDGSYYLPEGYMTLEDCLNLARRAKSKGMQIEYTIAYSDYWVDGEKQMVPYSWQQEITQQGLTGEPLIAYLENKVYEYTKTSMQAMIDQGTCPEYVSIGNEIQVGILFNHYRSSNGLYNKPEPLARLLNAGAKAVRETAPNAKIILHSDNGGKVSRRSTFINAMKQVDFDVIGASFYPFYNADVSIDTVVSEFSTFVNQYDKDVIIMETGYNWNPLKADGYPGQLQNSGYYQDIYGESENGQRAFLTELYAKLKTVLGGRCIGDLYWDPVMVHSPEWKIGWAIRESDDVTDSNVVPNSTIFDFDGKAVEGQNAMRDNANSTDKLLITGRITDKDGAPVTDAGLTFTADGKSYSTETDAYGEYIAAVDYPNSESIAVGVIGCTGAEQLAVPRYDNVIRGADFAQTEPTVPPSDSPAPPHELYGFTINENKFTAKCDDPDSEMFVAEYDNDGRLLAVHADAREGGIMPETAEVKAFAWKRDTHAPVWSYKQ